MHGLVFRPLGVGIWVLALRIGVGGSLINGTDALTKCRCAPEISLLKFLICTTTVMAKRVSKTKAASARRAPKKKAVRKRRTAKSNADPSVLSDRHRDEVLKRLRALSAKPTHATEHLGPVLPLDMGPPEKPKKRAAKKKRAVKRKSAKAGRKK